MADALATEERMKQDYRIEFDSFPWEQAMPGVRQKAVVQGGKRVRLVENSKAMPPHWCAKGHCGYILQGRFEVEFAAGPVVFGEGDGVCIPDGEAHRHRARALTDCVRAVFVEDA
jgi:quercetin dioxygenase-like cupin family protein